MADVKSFVFKGDWHDKLIEIEDEQERNAFVWRVVHYGVTGEFESTGDKFKDGWLKTICEMVDWSKNNYKNKIENGGKQQEEVSHLVEKS